MPYLSWTPTIGRNSAFVDLTEEQREELGGIEYRALKTLAVAAGMLALGSRLPRLREAKYLELSWKLGITLALANIFLVGVIALVVPI